MQDFNHSRFAVIADIHSNSDALAAVLRDIGNQSIKSGNSQAPQRISGFGLHFRR